MEVDEATAAICGLFCGTCPSYPHTCRGCLSGSTTADCRLCAAGFRTCTTEHGVTRCYECDSFPCKRLEDFSARHWENGICHHATIIADLRAMKELGPAGWVIQKTEENTCMYCGRLIHWFDKHTHKCGG